MTLSIVWLRCATIFFIGPNYFFFLIKNLKLNMRQSQIPLSKPGLAQPMTRPGSLWLASSLSTKNIGGLLQDQKTYTFFFKVKKHIYD